MNLQLPIFTLLFLRMNLNNKNKSKEEEYFKEMQRGDIKAFEYFFKEYMRLLYSYALGFVKEKETAEDIVQDTFVYFWNHRERIQYTGSVFAYLQRAVKNACVNKRLREQVERKYRQEILYTEEESFDWRDVEAVRETRQQILDAIERLPEKCKQIFMLSCIEGLKYREIAEQMGISENTIKTQVKLAYKKLREDVYLSGDEWAVLLIIFLFDFF